MLAPQAGRAVAEETKFTYHLSPNGSAGDWYREVTTGGNIIALARTQAQARADAIRAAASYGKESGP
jgi:hypothetical protein